VTLTASAGRLVDGCDVLLLDLDGVVYVGPDAVPGAVEVLGRASGRGLTLRYATNNAARPADEVAAHLRRLGLPADGEDVVTSAQAAAALVHERLGDGARVLGVGGPGVALALGARGLTPVEAAGDEPAAVVQGYGPDVCWRQLAEAAYAVAAGAWWVATNTDATLPTERGTAPGNGTLIAAVATATGRQPEVAGKPEPTLFRLAATGFESPLVVGDRLDTDIEAAVCAGMPSLLVLTGVTTPEVLLGADPQHRPAHLARDLTGLEVPHEAPVRGDGGWCCGAARARVVDGRLRIEPGADTGGDGLDPLRAACAAAWEAEDAGHRVEPDAEAARWLRSVVGAGR
jgi:HAD superfamily hydrolase (TIGR01450 family)